MASERAARTSAPRWVAMAMTMAALVVAGGTAVVACGSDADVESIEDGGVEASSNDAPVTPPPPVDGQSPQDAGATIDGACDAAVQADADIDCNGKCGPVKDPCTGKIKQCGGCQAVVVDGGATEKRVCDLLTNSCIKPKVTCSDLAAECGTVKDSCGNYLDCPDTNPKGCATGKECDPDTHKCRDCQAVTCKDLGYECGFAWLGCGEDNAANQTDCGGCAPTADGGTRVCNGVFHVCEPSCVPQSAAVLCAAAKTKRGVECGVISNGCGGTVSCDAVAGFGCANGESCGVRGIANRCDTKQVADECKAAGRNCGTLTSACTGLAVQCGNCPAGEVCNSNGVCGKPCTAKTCTDFAAFECGTFDDTCGGTVTCGACASGVCNSVTKTCCNANTCAGTYPGKCGDNLPNGCGQNVLDCNCAAGTTCTTNGGATAPPPISTPGMCCTPKTAADYTAAAQCGTNLPNGCGLSNINVSCGANKECVNNATGAPGAAPPNGVPGSCCTRTDSCNLAAGSCGPIQNSCRPAGVTTACNKCTAPTQCVANTCCQPAPACTGGGNVGGECNTAKLPVDPGCGSNRTCACKAGLVCSCGGVPCTAADPAGTCVAPLTCASPGYAGNCGTALPNGVGGFINCGCATGKVCSTATPGAIGTCGCNNPTGSPYNCANVPGGPGQPGGDACGSFNDGCGSTLACNCAAGTVCNTTPNPNVCCAPASCPAVPGIGTACGNVTNGCTTVSCACPSGAGKENFACVAGTCACVKDTCRGRTGPQPDRCGGTLQCGG
jgi:hypothetical protein